MKYKYIWAWGRLLLSLDYYIKGEVEKAKTEGAPVTAIYRRQDGTWATFEDITNSETKAHIEELVSEMEGENQETFSKDLLGNEYTFSPQEGYDYSKDTEYRVSDCNGDGCKSMESAYYIDASADGIMNAYSVGETVELVGFNRVENTVVLANHTEELIFSMSRQRFERDFSASSVAQSDVKIPGKEEK